jgi:hypothetical protein
MTQNPGEITMSFGHAGPAGTRRSAERRGRSGPFFPDADSDEVPLPFFWPPERVLFFDPQRRAATPELKAAIKSLSTFLEHSEAALGLRERRRSASAYADFKLAIEAVTCNLVVLLMMDPARPLAIPRHHGAMWGKSRYRPPVYGQHFLDVIELMAHPRVCLITELAPGYGYQGGKSRQSLIRVSRRLKDHLPSCLGWSELRREDEPEVVVLRGQKDQATGKASEIDYSETTTTRRLRKQVDRINRYLRTAPIFLLPDSQAETDDGQPVDPTRRAVRRIFNNGSWDQGGRLYGGFWETMRRVDRERLLRIGTNTCPEGERVANVDYGQLFARLAYFEVGQSPAPDVDLYDIVGDGQNRDGWKRLVNVLLLTEKPLRNWPEGVLEEFSPGTVLKELLTAIYQRHAPIAHLFGCGAGLRLMRRESDILIEVVLRLFADGITALPLHDSVLVASQEVAAAEAVMTAVFAKKTAGGAASIKTTFLE